MATLISYPLSTGDGHIYVSGTFDYNFQRSRTSGTLSTSSETLAVGQLISSGYLLYQSFLSFDTSAIEDNMAVTSAILSLYLYSDSSAQDFVVEIRKYQWETLTTTTWIPGQLVSNYPLLTSLPVSPSGGYNSFPSSPELCENINFTGNTQFIMVSDRFTQGIPPATDVFELVSWQSADYIGTTRDPKLTITYEEPSSTNGSITTVIPSANINSLMPDIFSERNNNIYANTLSNNLSAYVPIITSVHPPILNVSQIGESITLNWT